MYQVLLFKFKRHLCKGSVSFVFEINCSLHLEINRTLLYREMVFVLGLGKKQTTLESNATHFKIQTAV